MARERSLDPVCLVDRQYWSAAPKMEGIGALIFGASAGARRSRP